MLKFLSFVLGTMIKINYVISDHSGVIQDDLARVVDATNGVFRDYRVPQISIAEFKDQFKIPFDDFYKARGITDSQERIQSSFRKHYEESRVPVKPFFGAVDALRILWKKQKKMSVISGHPQQYLDQDLENYSLKNCLEEAIGNAVEKKDAMEDLLKRHNLDPKEVLLVEDMEYEIKSAKELGINTVGVTCGYRNFYIINSSKPDLIVPSLHRLFMQWHTQFE